MIFLNTPSWKRHWKNIGSNMGAELASMRVTEQIDAMEVSSINPFKFLVRKRKTNEENS